MQGDWKGKLSPSLRAAKRRQVLPRETIRPALPRWTAWLGGMLSFAKCDAVECILNAGLDGGGTAGAFAEIDVELVRRR